MGIRTTRLHPGRYYHIYNRGVNRQPIFFEEKNYSYFLQKYDQFVSPVVDTFAYCLIRNHFHLLVRVKGEDKLSESIRLGLEKDYSWHISNSLSSFFQSYTRSVNKFYGRTGSLFENPFKRIEVRDDSYFTALVAYIHLNPVKHCIVEDFKTYTHSSFRSLISSTKTKLKRSEVLGWFGGREQFEEYHDAQGSEMLRAELSLE